MVFNLWLKYKDNLISIKDMEESINLYIKFLKEKSRDNSYLFLSIEYYIGYVGIPFIQ